MTDKALWRRDATEGPDSPYRHAPAAPAEVPDYRTLTYEVDGRVARLTFNRPEQGNSITPDTPVELADAVERADLDPRVRVIVLSGRGTGLLWGLRPRGECRTTDGRRPRRHRARPHRPDDQP